MKAGFLKPWINAKQHDVYIVYMSIDIFGLYWWCECNALYSFHECYVFGVIDKDK